MFEDNTLPEKSVPQPRTKHIPVFAQCLVGFLVVAVLIGMANPWGSSRIGEKARQMQATNNCRQIVISLHAYASDNSGRFPDGDTANDAFRELVKGGQLEDERVFSAPHSPFIPTMKWVSHLHTPNHWNTAKTTGP
ncbi:MAG: Prepilin-type N-terminal cleavage/methylation protein [Verrucomicrobiaceae bacterium]|nr:Prepilin-type N-terminal cleavage/methylation protein [Verrucomicrobiaceae bacterium]